MPFRVAIILIAIFRFINLPAQISGAGIPVEDRKSANNSVNNEFPYTFQTWDAHNGLISNFCNKVVADKNGYIYVATNTGLFSFNGNYFSPFPFTTGSDKINTGNVEDLIIDGNRRLWFASIDFGVGLIDLKNPASGIQYFNPPEEYLSSAKTNYGVSKLCFDKKGNLWVGIRGDGLYRFDTATRKFFYIQTDNPHSPYNQYIRHLSLHGNDTLFVGLINGLSLINLKSNKITHIQFKKTNTGKNIIPTVRKILHWDKDTFVIATDRGAYWLQLPGGETSDIITAENKINFASVNCNDVYKFPGKELWFATENQGVIFYRPASGKAGYSYSLSLYNKGIAKGFVSSFFEDGKNNLWIAHNNGLSIFRLYGTKFSSHSGKEENNPYAGVLIRNGDEAMCFKSDAVTTINASYNTTASHKISTLKAGARMPSCVMQKQQNEYILFLNDSFFTVNTATCKTELLPLDKSGVNKNLFIHFRIMQCFKDTIEKKEVWVMRVNVNKGSLLLCYYPENGSLQYLSKGRFTDTTYRFQYTKLIKQASGKYWASTLNSGLLFLNIHNPEENRIYTNDNKEDPFLPGNKIADMVQADDESLWLLAYNKGLCHFNYKNYDAPAYTLFAGTNGLSDLHLYNLVKDNYNNLWITSNNGLYCFETGAGHFYNFSAYSGFNALVPGVGDVDLLCTNDNYVFISDRYNNFVWFKSQQNYDAMSSVSLVLKSLIVNDSIINAGNINSQLKFSPQQNDIVFQYDVLDYSRIAHYSIMYKLDGFDKEWQTSVNSGSEYYRHLPGNEYVFRIKLKYANGTTSPEISVPFIITTVWYRTWWFMLLCLMAVTSAAYFINRLYVNQKLAKQKAAFEKRYAVEQERARISAELHDDLGGNLSTIHLLSEIIKEKLHDNANTGQIDKISASSKELLSKLNEIVWSLNINNDTLDNLASYLREQSAKMLSEASLLYTFDITEQIPPLKINGTIRRHILLLVKEALHNIIKHANATHITFCIATNETLEIMIQDNGKGIPSECIKTSKGNGISNMQKHAEAVGGTLSIENGEGTKIKLVVELKKLCLEDVV